MSEKILKQARTEDIQIIENILLDMVSWLNEQLPSFHRTITHGAKQSGFRCRLSRKRGNYEETCFYRGGIRCR